MEHAEAWIAMLIQEQHLSEEEVVLIAMAEGSVQLLVGLSKNAFDSLERAQSQGDGERLSIVSMKAYEGLEPIKKRAWRLIATDRPPLRVNDVLWPAITFDEALEEVARSSPSGPAPEPAPDRPSRQATQSVEGAEPVDAIWSFLKSMPARIVDPPLSFVEEGTRIVDFVKAAGDTEACAVVLNLHAPAGYGKTTLLRWVNEQIADTFPTSFVQVSPYETLSTLLRHIIDELARQFPDEALRPVIESQACQDKDVLADLILRFGRNARAFGKVIVLLLDDYDVMPPEAQDWFETVLLGELVQDECAAVVLTSEVNPLRFKTFSVRRRCTQRAFLGFNTESISSLFPPYGHLASQMYRVTGGIPVLVERLAVSLGNSGVRTRSDFRSRERGLVSKFYRAHIPQTLLSGLNEEMQRTLLALASLRHFDVYVLSKVLRISLPGFHQAEDMPYYISLIHRLVAHRLVVWNASSENYILTDDAFRIVLQKYTLIEYPELFTRVHTGALSFYRDVLSKRFLPSYLMESLYHALVLLRLEGISKPAVVQLRLEEELLHSLAPHRADLTPEALETLGYAITQDPELGVWITKEVWERCLEL
jgi:hypothetical protein